MKVYRALDLSDNYQQPLTEAGRKKKDRTDLNIRYPTEHDERQGWVSVLSFEIVESPSFRFW